MSKLTTEKIIASLKENKEILKKYLVRRIGLFGSFARGTQGPESDLDFVVEFEKTSFDNFMDLASFLENLFGRKVDLLTPAGIADIRIKSVAENIKKGLIYVK